MKKKKGGGGANWMDTYGDMVTLLLCFFVLLYSMSTISEEKWRAIVTSFNPRASQTPTATPGTDGPNADLESQGGDPSAVPTPDPLEETQEDIDLAIEQLYQAIKHYAEEEGLSNSISVTTDNGKVYVTFSETTFFNPDKSYILPASYPILDKVGEVLSGAAFAIDDVRVQGHTAQATANAPNPIPGDRRLASERATNVVIYIQEHTDREILDPAKLISEGLGQWHPIASNATAEERAKNRRVEMIVSGRNLEEELGDSIQHYETITTQ
ncbi:MAG: OmpA family protein [Lawsonibacter sp.]|nr:OmpA family protein [Lawsonibacter sp.]